MFTILLFVAWTVVALLAGSKYQPAIRKDAITGIIYFDYKGSAGVIVSTKLYPFS